MKRTFTAALAAAAIASATPALAVDFILSGNPANPNFLNFRLVTSSAQSQTASLEHVIPTSGGFTDNFYFATLLPSSIGGGAATNNSAAQLLFQTIPNVGLTITEYSFASAPGAQAALQSAFLAADYSAQLGFIQAWTDGNGGNGEAAITNFIIGAGDAIQQRLDNVPINNESFYRISVSGTTTEPGAYYNGNLSLNAVPEPTTWAMMLAGFGLVGFAMRRKSQPHSKVRFAF